MKHFIAPNPLKMHYAPCGFALIAPQLLSTKMSPRLSLIARSNGEEINYESLASDSQVSADTIRNYFQILEDTLIGFRLVGFTKTKIRKATSRAKHYLFDLGVSNTLARLRNILPQSEVFGKAFEHFIILEVRAYCSYRRKKRELYYWRSTSKFKVDLLVEDQIAIEIKSSKSISDRQLKGLRALKEEKMIEKYLVVSQDPAPRVTSDHIEILPWQIFLTKLWAGEFF